MCSHGVTLWLLLCLANVSQGLSVAKEPASGLVTPKKDGLWCLLIKPTSTAAQAVQAYYRFLVSVRTLRCAFKHVSVYVCMAFSSA